jgi:hypothetical protein
MKRREFVGLALASAAPAAGVARKKIAAPSTACHVRSHSDNFLTRFIGGCWINVESEQDV